MVRIIFILTVVNILALAKQPAGLERIIVDCSKSANEQVCVEGRKLAEEDERMRMAQRGFYPAKGGGWYWAPYGTVPVDAKPPEKPRLTLKRALKNIWVKAK